jgi:hypothetical protein
MIPNRKPKPVKVKPAQTVQSRITRSGPVIRPGTRASQAVKIEQRPIAPLKRAEPAASHPPQPYSIPAKWKGETCYIIGGGPSLAGFDWGRLAGRKTIAINKAFLSYPDADILYWTDSRFYSWHKSEIDAFGGERYTLRWNQEHKGDIKLLNKGMRFGLETRRDTLAHGNNSGYAAVNLAYHLGVKRIVLLGYDMGNLGGKSHFHEGYPTRPTPDDVYEKQFIPGFKMLADLLKQQGVEVWNACMSSKLTVFPKISLDRALSFR